LDQIGDEQPEVERGSFVNHFFLSYARGDDDEYVQRFYSDLCREIRVDKGLGRGERVGFLDSTSIRVGSHWSKELVTALTECAVFLPLYAPGYFLSEFCGREWAAFEYRLRQHRDSPDTAGGFIPVVWLQPRHLPEAATTLQYSCGTFGKAYGEYGLRQLIRLRRYEDDYRETVTALAAEIARIARRCTAVPSPLDVDLATLTSAFHRPGSPARAVDDVPYEPSGPSPAAAAPKPRGDAGPAPADEGLAPIETGSVPVEGSPLAKGDNRHVHFVIASTGRDEIQTVRSCLTCYGTTEQHWAPYRPALPEPLGPFACEIAAGQRLRAELAGLDDLPDRLDRANERNQIVVLLVDPWTTRVSGYGQALLDYDRRNEPTVPVLVAVSDHDPETRENRESLKRAVVETFPNNSARSDPIFHPDVRSPEQFAEKLDKALQIALNRLMRRGTVFRVPPREATFPRVVLDSPDSLSNRRSP
jgi:FxsC-like protein